MQSTLAWWLALELLGFLALPCLFLIFPRLPDRGLCFAKAFGALAVGYLLWLSGSSHLFPNGRGAVALVTFLLALGALLLFQRYRSEMMAFLRRERRALLVYELVFAAAFVLWALVRAFNPQIEGTEKPMDFAMMNAALRSTAFPPQDPWLSGYTLNYYYFGYLIMGALTQLGGTQAAVGYNLALAFVFAATCVGAWGLVTNLVSLHVGHGQGSASISRSALAYGALGALLVLGIANLEGALELVRAHGGGSQGFWTWVSIKKGTGLLGVSPLNAPYQSATWYPSENWWWWRATRVIDTVVDGQSKDYTITEFPFFSFLLGDLHPHLMALPFVLLAIGLSLHLVIGQGPGLRRWLDASPYRFLAPMFILGSLGFINGWDLVPYLGLYFGAAALRTWLDSPGLSWKVWGDLVAWGVVIAAGAFILYAPFYGVLGWHVTSAILAGPAEAGVSGFPLAWWEGPGTRPAHFLLLWTPFLFVTGSFLCVVAWRTARSSLLWVLAALAGMVSIWILVETSLVFLPSGVAESRPLDLLQRTWPLLPVAAAASLWFHSGLRRTDAPAEQRSFPTVAFILLLIAWAFLLIATSESFRIKDVFGNRMNTVFKLYYQAWLLLALAGAFAVFYVNTHLKAGRFLQRGIWNGVLGLLLVASGAYSSAAIFSRTDAFSGRATLDGLAYLDRVDPDEAKALRWLSSQPTQGKGAILEATGGQYTRYGRVASSTGIPTVLGWAGHEVQWRGSERALRGREEDIDRVYQAEDKSLIVPLLDKYNIHYVYVGSLEREKYPAGSLEAFSRALEVVFQNDRVTIYKTLRTPGTG